MNVNRNLENNKSGAWILRSFSYSTDRFILIESATYWSYHLFRKTYWSLYPGCSISCTFWYLILTKPKKIHSVCVIMVAQLKGKCSIICSYLYNLNRSTSQLIIFTWKKRFAGLLSCFAFIDHNAKRSSILMMCQKLVIN